MVKVGKPRKENKGIGKAGKEAAPPPEFPEFVAEDGRVLDAVIDALLGDAHLIGYRNWDFGTAIRLADRTPGRIPELFPLEGFDEIKSRGAPLPRELHHSLIERNREPVELKLYRPDARWVRVVSWKDVPPAPKGLARYAKKHQGAKSYLTPWLPGYSSDGAFAYVRYLIGTAPTARLSTLLRLEGRGWQALKTWHSEV